MAEFGRIPVLDVWYARMDAETVIPTLKDRQTRKRSRKRLAQARRRGVLEHDYPKLTHVVGGQPQIKDDPPLIFHLPRDQARLADEVHEVFAKYRDTLEYDRQLLLDRYQLRDMAVKVVGVGSVGTRCGIMLLLANERDPLFLQVKEAGASVLEAYAGKSMFRNHGERVVNGYRLMQSASDLFLGWVVGPSGRHFYIRQLNDVKLKVLVELFSPSVMIQYAELCGWTLAIGHARSGEPARLSGYLGKGDRFDEAIAAFSVAYADQCERDYKVFRKAVREGRLEIQEV